jgi:hypothetical protein
MTLMDAFEVFKAIFSTKKREEERGVPSSYPPMVSSNLEGFHGLEVFWELTASD